MITRRSMLAASVGAVCGGSALANHQDREEIDWDDILLHDGKIEGVFQVLSNYRVIGRREFDYNNIRVIEFVLMYEDKYRLVWIRSPFGSVEIDGKPNGCFCYNFDNFGRWELAQYHVWEQFSGYWQEALGEVKFWSQFKRDNEDKRPTSVRAEYNER